jgi:hypothetical protein
MARAGLVLCPCPSSDRRRRAVDRDDSENVLKREFLPLEEVEVVIQPTVQAPLPADRQPDPAPRSRSLFRCIPYDCYTTLVHSPLLVFACSLSAGYFGVSLTFGLLLRTFGGMDKDQDLFLLHCSDIFAGQVCAGEVGVIYSSEGEIDGGNEASQAKSAANELLLIALILALLINNKWLKCQCTARPKTSICTQVAVCLLTGVIGLAAFIAWTVEVSACFSCKLAPLDHQANSTIIYESLFLVMRFESFLGVITSLFLLIAVAWMALGRVPWIASMKLFRGHADLADERASTIRHLLTSRVYIGLLAGLLVNIAVVIYYGSADHTALANMDAEGAGGEDEFMKPVHIFELILLYVQLAVCVLASAFNGWKHLQHWRIVTKVARAQVTPTPAEGISPAQPDGLDAEHSRLLDVGSKSLISASRLPALMCSSLACGSVIIALVLSSIITALYMWSTNEVVRANAAPILPSLGYSLTLLISGVLARMVLVRCLFHPKQLRGGGEVWPMRRPICFAWYEAVYLVFAIGDGIWFGASRLVNTIANAITSLLRMDRPSFSEGRVVHDVVFRSYAAVLCLERDAEASRRQAGATHFESGVLAVESDVILKHTALWCLGWLATAIPFIIFVSIFGVPGDDSD